MAGTVVFGDDESVRVLELFVAAAKVVGPTMTATGFAGMSSEETSPPVDDDEMADATVVAEDKDPNV